MKTIIFSVGWLCFCVILTIFIGLQLTSGILGSIAIISFFAVIFPFRLLLYFSKHTYINWYSQLATYLLTLPLLLLLFAGYADITCAYQLFPPGMDAVWDELVCATGKILNLLQIVTIAFLIGFAWILLGAFGQRNPNATSYLQRVEKRTYFLDVIANALGMAAIVAILTVIGLFIFGKRSYWVVLPIGSLLLASLTSELKAPLWKTVFKFFIIAISALIVLLPALIEGVCWWSTHFTWISWLPHVSNCQSLRMIY